MLEGSPERLGVLLAPASPSLCLQSPGSSLPWALSVGQACPHTPSELIPHPEEERGGSSSSRCLWGPCSTGGSRKTHISWNTALPPELVLVCAPPHGPGERPQHVPSTRFWVCSCLLTLWSKPLTNVPGFPHASPASLFFQKAAVSMVLKHFPGFTYSCDTVQPAVRSSRPLALIPSAGPRSGRPLQPGCFWNEGEGRVSLRAGRSFVPGGDRELDALGVWARCLWFPLQ